MSRAIFPVFALLLMVACGGSSSSPSEPSQADPVMVAAVQNAFAATDPDADLNTFYNRTASTTHEDAVMSFLAALQNTGSMNPVLETMLATGQIFGSETGAVQTLGLTNPCSSSDTVIWFVNGIWNTPWNALSSLRELRRVAIEAGLNADQNSTLLFYNDSGLNSDSLSGEICNFIFGANGIVDSITPTLKLISDSWQAAAVNACGGTIDFAEAAGQWAQQILPFTPTLDASEVKEFRSLLRQDIAAGKKVIIVAHSQGNLFTQKALEGLLLSERSAVGVLAIASPAFYPEQASYGFFNYLMLHGDVVASFNNSLEPNGTNELTDAEASMFTIHQFVESYLAQPRSRQRIRQMLQTANAATSNVRAPLGRGFLQVTASWDPAPDGQDFDLDIIEPHDVDDPTGGWLHETQRQGNIGQLDRVFHYSDYFNGVTEAVENYVVCSKSQMRTGEYEIRIDSDGTIQQTKLNIQIRAGTKTWSFTGSGHGLDLEFVAIVTYHPNGTFTLGNVWQHPGYGSIFDETGGK